MHFHFPLLVCDIGGTNIRVAIKKSPDSILSEPIFLKTKDFTSLPAAILAAGTATDTIESIIACGAGPVVNRQLKLTNAPWHIDGLEIAHALNLKQGLLLNDFEAQALSLAVINKPDHYLIKSGHYSNGTQLILGPGTGLGVGGLIDFHGCFKALTSEACHIDFAPSGRAQELIWPHLERVFGRITTESVMSGAGLARLHRARMISLNQPDHRLDAIQISKIALADPNGFEADTLGMYWQIIARFAGDMALTFIATGGVVLSGGILPRLIEFLDKVTFSEAFVAKAPVQSLVHEIPVILLTQKDTVLNGMADIAVRPDLYAIDYESRAWCTPIHLI